MTERRDVLVNVVGMAGLGLTFVGIAAWSLPAATVSVGLFLVGAAVYAARR